MELGLKVTKNSDKFRGPAIHFEKHNTYHFAPPGTSEYIKYWTDEMNHCLHGYEAEDGDYIPGYFYFYLNYFTISLTKDVEIDVRGEKIARVNRVMDFPRFYDYDRYFFEVVQACDDLGKHLVVLKARRKGYSYKIAAMLCRNYYLIKGSSNYALASEAEFLVRDGILTKAWDGMDFVDANTAWYKKRQKTDTKMHKRASFIMKDESGVPIEMGYKSEIMGVTLKNDPQKARGKSGKLIIFEEAGKFPNLLQAWQIARPSVEQGSNVLGLMIAFGTGGTEDADYEGLRNLFEDPEAYGCIVLKNIWDDHLYNTDCGFFIPQYANLEGNHPDTGEPFMDEDGNTRVEIAKSYVLAERDKVIKNASDRRAIDRHIAEQPITPAEATLNISTNIFPKSELKNHISFIRTHKSVKDFKQVGDLLFNEKGKPKWVLNPLLKDITKFPLKPEDDKRGAIVVWEHPGDEIPYGLYVIGCDPYDHDSSTTDSLGSAIVYKRIQNFESYYDLPVAEYTGRPDSADEFYEKVRMLAFYYNAQILYENEKKGLFSYFSHKHCEHLLVDQPNIIKDIIKDSKVERSKGVHMNKQIKQWGEGLIKDWLNEEYSPGKKNLTKIYSEALIEELISYNPDKGNYDRVMSFMMVMIYIQELYHVNVKKKKAEARKNVLFKDGIFRNDDNYRLIINSN